MLLHGLVNPGEEREIPHEANDVAMSIPEAARGNLLGVGKGVQETEHGDVAIAQL